MSDYVTEQIFLEEVSNPNFLEEDVKIEEYQDIDVVVKQESEDHHESGRSPESPFKRDDNGQFPCEVCGKRFHQPSRMKDHMVRHSEERHHKCSDCDYAAKRRGDLIKHININHLTKTFFQCDANGQFSCDVCGMKFLQRSEIKDHRAGHGQEMNHKCSDCDYVAKTKGNLIVHTRRLHPFQTSFQCEVCSKKFSGLWLLKRHSVSHNGEKLFKCDQCSTTYKNKQSLRDHNALVHDNKGGFSCEVCGNKFLYRSKLDEHMVKHNEERKHKCSDCDYAAKSKGDLTHHVRTLHPAETPFQCEGCLKSFSTLSLLKKHSSSHNEEKLFKCDQCSTTYKNKQSLRDHNALVHDDKGGFSCEVCGNKFLYRSKLDEHMVKHNEERKHKCSDCDYMAKSKEDLTVHIQILHSTETPFQYEVCLKSFLASSLLKKHSVSHNEKKLFNPFKCDQCSTIYKSKKSLRNHKATVHDNKGRLRCEVCGSKFLYRSKLKEHMDRHSKERKHKCSECGSGFKSKGDLSKHISLVHLNNERKLTSIKLDPPPAINNQSSEVSDTLPLKHSSEEPYHCGQCERRFDTFSNLKLHLSAHKTTAHYVGKSFKCKKCFKNFQTAVRLKHHLFTHRKDRTFQCDMCPKTFKADIYIYQHMRKVHKIIKKIHSCDLCGRKFKLKATLNKHIKSQHEIERVETSEKTDLKVEPIVIYDPVEKRDVSNMPLEVQKIDVKIEPEIMEEYNKERNHKNRGELGEHINTKHGPETLFQCGVCSKSYATLSLLKDHSVHHEESLKCKTNLTQHENESTLPYKVCGKNNEMNYKCSKCVYATNRKSDLLKHINRLHPTETPFQCEVCSKSHATLSLLKRHATKHSKEKPFKCDQCSDTFKWKDSLNNHKVLVHDGGGKFPCEVCGIKFIYRAKLNEHMTRHSEGRDYKCSECEYAGKRKIDLKQHMKSHSREKNHKCSECGVEFKTKLVLNKHVMAHHTLFQCKVCLRSFATLSLLKRHYLNHDKRKPSNSIEALKETDLKVEPTVIYDPEEKRDISHVKQETEEEEVKKEPEYMEEMFGIVNIYS